MAMAKQPGLSDGITSPPIWVVMEAASRSIPAASITLKPAHGAVEPVSALIAWMKASVRASSFSAAFSSSARRWLGDVAAQAGNAAAAASAAALASATLAAAARVATVPEMGSWRS
jgi:hypothetical protein